MGTKKSLTNLVLLALEKTVDGYIRFEDFAYHHYRYRYGIPELRKSDFSQALKRLRERGLIELVSDEKLIYKLTDRGKDHALWVKMKLNNEKWDGKWRLVIWDIPEKRRVVRDILRFKLKQLGFTRWQKSVWASKVNCTDLLRKFIKQIGIEDWVMIIESDNVNY